MEHHIAECILCKCGRCACVCAFFLRCAFEILFFVPPSFPHFLVEQYFFFSIVSIFSCATACYQYPINTNASIHYGASSWCWYLLFNLIIYIPHAIASLTNFVHTGTPSLLYECTLVFFLFFLFVFLFQFLRLRLFPLRFPVKKIENVNRFNGDTKTQHTHTIIARALARSHIFAYRSKQRSTESYYQPMPNRPEPTTISLP